MDIATVIGILLGLSLVLGAILMGGGATAFINIPSLMITFGGTVAATLISHPLQKVIGTISVVQKAFFHKAPEPFRIITMLTEFATKARKDGMLALESDIEKIEDNFLKKGMQMAVDGTSPELIKVILETDLNYLEDRHREGQGLFQTMGTYAPAFGMIGTLIGLIQMLRTMEDPSTIGTGMAVALLTTFYGALAANLVFLPIAGKLKSRSNEELLLKQLMIEGILSLQSGDNPRVVEEKLKAFLSPKLRNEMAAAKKNK